MVHVRTLCSIVGGTIVAAMGSPVPPAAGAPADAGRVLAVDNRPPAVAAHAGIVVWSRYHERTRRFTLMARRGGRTFPLRGVAPSRRAAPVDLGPGRDGSTVAVYARCRAGDCDVYEYSFRTRRERPYPGASSPGLDEISPTIWRGTLAFMVRRRIDRARHEGRVMLVRGGRARALPVVRRAVLDGYTGPIEMDLRGDRLAVEWIRPVQQCPSPSEEGKDIDPDGTRPRMTEIWSFDLGGGRRVLEAGCDMGSGVYAVESPSALADAVAYNRATDAGDSVREVRRDGRIRDRPHAERWIDLEIDGSDTFFVRWEVRGEKDRFELVQAAGAAD